VQASAGPVESGVLVITAGPGTNKLLELMACAMSWTEAGSWNSLDHDEWGGWGSNPRPADYESAPPPSAPVRDSPELGR
jgi:hypothetical protein